MDNFQEHPVDVEKEEMAAAIRELNRDLDLHDIIVSTYKSEIAYLKAENERYRKALKTIKNGCRDNICNFCLTTVIEALQGKKGSE